jgi:hypothetical protein
MLSSPQGNRQNGARCRPRRFANPRGPSPCYGWCWLSERPWRPPRCVRTGGVGCHQLFREGHAQGRPRAWGSGQLGRSEARRMGAGLLLKPGSNGGREKSGKAEMALEAAWGSQGAFLTLIGGVFRICLASAFHVKAAASCAPGLDAKGGTEPAGQSRGLFKVFHSHKTASRVSGVLLKGQKPDSLVPAMECPRGWVVGRSHEASVHDR